MGHVLVCCSTDLLLTFVVMCRSDQNMLQCFLTAASVGEANSYLDELNIDVRCNCISCVGLERR